MGGDDDLPSRPGADQHESAGQGELSSKNWVRVSRWQAEDARLGDAEGSPPTSFRLLPAQRLEERKKHMPQGQGHREGQEVARRESVGNPFSQAEQVRTDCKAGDELGGYRDLQIDVQRILPGSCFILEEMQSHYAAIEEKKKKWQEEVARSAQTRRTGGDCWGTRVSRDLLASPSQGRGIADMLMGGGGNANKN